MPTHRSRRINPMIATEARPLFAVFEPMPVIERIWQAAGLPVDRLPELSLTGSPGPELRSSFMISEAAQVRLLHLHKDTVNPSGHNSTFRTCCELPERASDR